MTNREAQNTVGTREVRRTYRDSFVGNHIFEIGANTGYLGLNWKLFYSTTDNVFLIYVNRNSPNFTNYENC